MARFAGAMGDRHDLDVLSLDQEMNQIRESPDDREAEIKFWRGEFASGKTKWTRFDTCKSFIDGLPEFVAETDALAIEPECGFSNVLERWRKDTESHVALSWAKRSLIMARVSSRE
jgi:hypothetical protein